MSMQEGTTLGKGRDGVEAKTTRLLPDGRALIVTTRKASRGGLDTSAMVVKPNEHGFTWSPFEDFNELLRKAPALRCTERNVMEEHQKALVDMEAIKARAVAHYAKATEDEASN